MIVSLGEPNGFSIQSTGDTVAVQKAIIEESDFAVLDSLLGSEKEGEIGALSNEVKANVIEEMGFVYLIGYSEDDYSSYEEAKEGLESYLKEQGLDVKDIEPNYVINVDPITEDEEEISANMHRSQRWHYEMINAPQVWNNITDGSRNVKVAVLDTGIDANHPNLRDIVDRSLGRDFTGDGIGDIQGHGTHVAGTIASYGSVSGVMKTANLIDVKVLGDRGRGSSYGIQQGIVYATNVGADVINMSLGGGGFLRGTNNAIRAAMQSGTIVVAATGNDGRGSISYPAAYTDAIAVGAVDSNRRRANFSNYGDGLEIMAPGVNIYSTHPTTSRSYAYLSGTSMATPHVAGVAGLMRAVNLDLSTAEARNILRDTAQPAGPSNKFGYGIVDAKEAVRAARNLAEPEPEPEPEPTIYAMQNRRSNNVVSRIVERSWFRTNVFIREANWQGRDSQQWRIHNLNNGFYAIQNQESDRVLDINTVLEGSVVVERQYQGNEHQQWRIVDLNNGFYAIQNRETGFVLYGMTGSNEIRQYSWNSSSNQQWRVVGLNSSSAENISIASVSDTDLEDLESIADEYTVDKSVVKEISK
ncbi:S8 family serine peptidase [Halonatronum saccharophilum]|uniref:S8 family serine peptidase n=1 Tax=Halonatronum saccharophilum TaxID=150060 RepID=UPI0004BA5E67|nr:S8 family serine peptidase [Halonatronum saccharophilum]